MSGRAIAVAVGGLLGIACSSKSTAPIRTPEQATEATPMPGAREGEAMVWPDEEFRDHRPDPGPRAPLRIPRVEPYSGPEGIDVYLVEQHTLPTVTMTLRFPTGGVVDPPRKRGTAGLCLDLLDEGTERLDKIAFAEAQADLASSVSAWATSESVGITMSTLRRNLEPTADLWVEMLRTPGLRETDFERLRARRKASLTQAKAAPASLGARLWPSVVYGPDHPYGRLVTEASLDRIKVADCRKLLHRLGPHGARLFVAGDVTAQEVDALLASRLSGWKGAAPQPPTLGPPTPRHGTIFFADVPGAAQSQVYVGSPGPPRTADDYPATRLLGGILGGSFSSRVNMNLREEKGFAYGARAGFSYRRRYGSFAARSSVRTDATADALRELGAEIAKIRTSEVMPEELERERAALVLGLPARFSTAQRILASYADLVFFGLPLDTYDHFVERFEAVDAEDILEAADRHLPAGDFEVLVVGDGAKVRADLEALAHDEVFGKKGLVELDGDGRVLASAGAEPRRRSR